MDENQVTVDVNELRAVADRVQRSADALNAFRMPQLHAADLPGSEVAEVMGSVRLADYFEVVIIALEDDLRIRRALSVAANIEFYRYQVKFTLTKA